jgi:hypothetical protein
MQAIRTLKRKLAGPELYARFEALLSTFTPGQLSRAGSVPKRFKPLYVRALCKETTSRQAIRAYCQHCVGWSELPDAVRDCTAKACPLYAFRPYQPKS